MQQKLLARLRIAKIHKVWIPLSKNLSNKYSRMVTQDKSLMHGHNEMGSVTKNYIQFHSITFIRFRLPVFLLAFLHQLPQVQTKNIIWNLLELEKPPFPPCTFDRILLDGPCSALGQRPQHSFKKSRQELESFPVYQRKLLSAVCKFIQVFASVIIIEEW